jgi:hypothetical protein
VKIFASASIRDGGKQTMTDQQLAAVCGEPTPRMDDGPRTARVDHGVGQRRLPADRARRVRDRRGAQADGRQGVYFDPNVGVVLQNYLKNRDKYNGIGNYNDEGFAYMEKGLGLNKTMIRRRSRRRG